MEVTNQDRFLRCYREWISQQETDLEELLSAGDGGDWTHDEERQRALVAKSLRHYDEYSVKRQSLAKADAAAFFCPAWCASFESSLLWMGGCRPSMFIRLVYTLSGSEVEAHVDELLSGAPERIGGGIAGLSARQLGNVNALHCRTIRAEDGLSGRMATLQEDVADKPLLPITKNRQRGGGGGGSVDCYVYGDNRAATAAMASYEESLLVIMEEADLLRVRTVRELLTEILTPLQAVELLVAAKQLHLSVRKWGRVGD